MAAQVSLISASQTEFKSGSSAGHGPSILLSQLEQQVQVESTEFKQQIQPTALPVVTIVEQPAQHYRFRYQSEVADTRLGGLLNGRSSDSSKSFIKVQISGIDPTLHSHLQLIARTVSSDRAPHPYYLHGDNCPNGYFEMNKSIDERSPSDWNVKFDKLAVICVPKKRKSDMKNAMEATRAAKVPKLHDMKEVSACSGNALFSSIRLAFSLTFTDKHGSNWILPTVFSDEISDHKQKIKSELSIECLNPEEVPLGVASEIAIYTKTPINGLQKKDLKVLFTIKSNDSNYESAEPTIELDVIDIRKHLLITKTPVFQSVENERLKCEVTVRYNQFVTKEKLNIVFIRKPQSGNYQILGISKKRTAPD